MKGQINYFDEISVDLFAGGGGASTGYELATGQPVTIAINHSRDAVLMHKTNHPWTEHYQADVFEVDPQTAVRGRNVGFLWASPDCRHFSKAKGAPLVDRKIRGLAWVILRWAMDVRPRVIMAENVEEIQTWGPLIWDEKRSGWVPDPERKGETFKAFIGMLTDGVPADCPALDEACEFLKVDRSGREARQLIRGLGYDLEHRELVAADYGAPTIRKRWVMVARCDGAPIIWPEPTHSKDGKGGKKKWRSAAEIIDWSLPMYSIFDTKEEIKARYGVNAIRPLADNTMKRCICGVDKFTIRSGKPFLIPTGYGERQGQAPRVNDIGAPLPTVVSTVKQSLCDPMLAPFGVECNHAGGGHVVDPEQSAPTITAKCTMGVCAPVIAPVTFSNTGGSVGFPADMPVHTVTSDGKQILSAAQLMSIGQLHGGNRVRSAEEPAPTAVSKAEACLLSAQLMQYHTERERETVRAADLRTPAPTVDGSNRHAMLAANLVEYYSTGRPITMEDPMHTATGHDREALTSAILQPIHAGGYHGRGNLPTAPVNTITASGGQRMVAAHVVEFKGQDKGQRAAAPLRTITQSAGEFALCHTVLVNADPGCDYGRWPEIRALLNRYCGYHLGDDEILLLIIDGAAFYIRDILLRMLSPRELYLAMGFPPDYIIDRDYMGNAYTKNKQVARCGNAVCPPMAEAVIRANYKAARVSIRSMAQLADMVAV